MAALALFISIGGGAYAATNLPANSVGSSQLKNSAVTNKKLGNGAVGTSKLSNGAVTGAKLKGGAVTAAKIGTGAVVSSKLASGAVTTNQLADSAVTSAKLANAAVTSGKVANDAIGEIQLNVANITSFVKGTGSMQMTAGSIAANNTFQNPGVVLATVPGFGQVRLIQCGNQAASFLSRVQMLSDDNSASFFAVGQGSGSPNPGGTPVAATIDGSSGQLGGGGGTLISAQATTAAGGMTATFEISYWRGAGTQTTGSHTTVSVFDDGANCNATAQTIIQG
jgi:hypothetical protein